MTDKEFISSLKSNALMAIIVIVAIAFVISVFSGCKKETTNCKTCTENVEYYSDVSPMQYYVQSTKVYCDNTWSAVDGNVHITQGSSQGIHWHKKVTTICR